MSAPKLRFKGFHDDWKKDSLGKITKLTDGTHSTPKYTSEGIPFWSVETITTNAPVKYISKQEHQELIKRCKPEKDDILITRISSGINSLGVPKLVDWDDEFSIYVSVGLIKASPFVNSKYLASYIDTPNYKKDFLSKSLLTATPKKINMNDLEKTIIFYPSLDEQKKIGEFYHLLHSKIQKQQEKVDLLKEQKKGYIKKIFSQELRFLDGNGQPYPDWKTKSLCTIAKVKTGDKNVQDNVPEGKYHFFDRSESIKYLNEYSFDEEAIIYPGEGSNFYPKYFMGKYALHQRAYSISDFSKDILPKFIYYQLSLKNNHFLKFAVGSTVPSLRMNAFETCILKIPCLDEQNKITQFLSKLDMKIEHEEHKLTILQQQRRAFMQQMFI